MSLRDEAQSIASTLEEPEAYGDPLSMILILLQIFSAAMSLCPQTTPQAAVSARIKSGDASNPDTVVFRQGAVRRQRRRARQAAIQSGQRNVTNEQCDDATIKAWRHVLKSDDATVAACCSEGMAVGSVDPGEGDEG